MTRVTIDAEYLETLLWFARRGDRANSERHWRYLWRKQNVCADHPEPDCHNCQAFAAAEDAIQEDE